MCVYVHAHEPWSVYWEVRRQLAGIGSLILPNGYWIELRFSGLAVSGLPTEPSHWPEDNFAKGSDFRQIYIYV